ncbi:MAG: nucleoside triphosphate pyrophosphatase [Candidatus Gracilibacteria bacterium]
MKIILGSSSKWRQQILQEAGIEFTVCSPDIDEKAIRHEDPKELVRLIAHAKNDAVLLKIQDPSLVITSDQVTVFEGVIREKPESEEEARMFLRSYSNAMVQTVTGVCVSNTETKELREGMDVAEVYFDTIPDHAIDLLIRQGDVMTCAGGFVTDNPLLDPYVKEIRGAKDSVIGMPLELTLSLLKQVQ